MITEQEIESYKRDLLDKYPDLYYHVSNYGYGDGKCYGPFNAFDALQGYCESTRQDAISNIKKGLPWYKNYICSIICQFESALITKHGCNKPIHYITSNDESDDFNDFMSS